MEPNELQLRILFQALRQELFYNWRTRYIEILPSGVLMVNFEHATNVNWRCLYTIPQDGEWKRREFYV